MSMCMPAPATAIPAARADVDDAVRGLRAADGVEWVSDAADHYRAVLADLIESSAHVIWALDQALHPVQAMHTAVDNAPAPTGWPGLPHIEVPGLLLGGAGSWLMTRLASPW
jgi:hypothetical protein